MLTGAYVLALVLLVANGVQYIYFLASKTRLEGRRVLTPMIAATGVLTLYLVMAPLVLDRTPLNSRQEIFALFGWSILSVYLLTNLSYPLQSMGSLVLPTSLLFLVGGLVQERSALGYGAVEWIPQFGFWIHVFLIVVAYGAFTVSFLMAVGYLRGEYQLRAKSVDSFFFLFPSLEALDRGLQQCLWIGLISLAAGISLAFAGGWLMGSFSVRWFSDPNVLAAIITGVIYSTLLSLRRRSLFTNRRIAYLAIVGFLFIGLLFVGMNYFTRMHRFL